jgi:hypothetical protein
MKTIKIISLYIITTLVFFGCHETEVIGPEKSMTSSELQVQSTTVSEFQTGNTYFVSTTGNDTGDGSAGNPWRTLRYAVTQVSASQGHTIRLSAGTFVESGRIDVPLGVSIEGAGKDQTILKAASSFYYNPASPGYSTDRFLISLSGFNAANGNQILKNFTVDGDGKKVHGGIYVRYRNNVVIENVKVQYTNFTGIWLWDVKDTKVNNVSLFNCSWGSAGWCAGALNLGNLERVDIAGLDIDESTGYGIKAIGPSGYNNLFQLKIHNSRVSVHPNGMWNNGSAPNIAIELWQVSPVGCEIYNTYVDNTISLVNSNMPQSTGVQTIRVHHNTLDMESRSNGAGYGVELTLHDAEIDHNYFIRGTQGIANWDNPCKNWSIHHNVFYGISGMYPGEIVRSQWSGLHNVKLYNNTIEFVGTKTSNVIGVYGGTSYNVEAKNNLVINNNTSYNYYPNKFLHTENGASVSNLVVTNNLLQNLSLGSLLGTVLNNLLSVDPKIVKTGNRPEPYYMPAAGSPLIDGGANVGLSFLGSGADIGALEYGTESNALPQVSITDPANNSSFAAGSTITINATASDSDGAISKVEFFNGAAKLGESLTSPYTFGWSNVAAGSYAVTAKATDNNGGVTISSAVSITVNSSTNAPPSVSITSPVANASFTSGSTITIAATASDTDGTIAKVEFFNGSTKLGEDLSSPYSFAWSNVPAGSYSLTATATDNGGATKTSSSLNITVTQQSSGSPTITIISPADNSVFAPGQLISIQATVSEPSNTVDRIEFYSDVTKIGEDRSHPYNFTLAAPASGSYVLTAKVYFKKGNVFTSPPVKFSISSANPAPVANQSPVVSIISPANNSTFSAGSTINISANATDADGTVSRVEFFSGSTKLGERLSAPYSFAWGNVPSGAYSLTVRAFDNKGASSVSGAVSVNVVNTTAAQVTLDASQATLSGIMTRGSDAQVSSFFYVPAGSGKNYYIPPSAAADFSFHAPKTDTYVMWVRVKAPTTSNQGYYIYDGKGTWITWNAGVHTDWTWVKVTNASTGAVGSFSFAEGTNYIKFGWYDDNVRVDRIFLTNDQQLVPN